MVNAFIAARQPEPVELAPAMAADDVVVLATLFVAVLLMALFTAGYVLRTRPRRHPLRVVRWPR